MAEKKVTKKKLDRNELDEFTPDLDGIPKEYLPTFALKQLDVKGKRALNMVTTKIRRDATLLMSDPSRESVLDSMDLENEELLDLVCKYVIGWENFKTADGESFVFEKDSKGYLSGDCFRQVSAIFQAEIIQRLQLISGLSDKEQLGLKS